MDLTLAAKTAFSGAVLNKVGAPEQRECMRSKLGIVSVPVIGTIAHDDAIQSAALAGRPCPLTAEAEIDRIVATLLLDAGGCCK